MHPDSIATIEIHSATHQVLSNTFDWVRCPVGEGSFSEETDRQRVGEVLCDMIKSKLQHYLDEEDFHNYRLLLNTQAVHFRKLSVRSVESLLPHTCSDEQDPASFALGQFLEQNGFANAVERNDVGWTPLCYAALAGDPLVLAALLQQKANVNDGIGRQDPMLQFASGTSVLDICVCLHHNNAARMLIDFSADLRQKDGLRATAAHWACVGNNVEGSCPRIIRIYGASAGDYSYIFLLSPCIGLGAVRRCSGKLRLYHLSNRSSYCRYNQTKTSNIGALMITYTILGVPYSNYSILGPETLFQLLRPLHYRTLLVALAVTLKDPL